MLEDSRQRAPGSDGGSSPAGEHAIRTLLVSDLVGSTALMERLGDAPAAELFRQHDWLARDLLDEHRGVEIDKTDGFLLIFERPLEAVLYALAYHRGLHRLSAEHGLELRARVGIHLGEVELVRNRPEDVAREPSPSKSRGSPSPLPHGSCRSRLAARRS